MDTSRWPARWNCGQWSDLLGWTHIISDTAVFLAYGAIAALLAWFLTRIKANKFNHLFFLSSLFILFCGVGHLIEAVIFYYPVYNLAGIWKVMTATISWVTVIAMGIFANEWLKKPNLIEENRKLSDQVVRGKEALVSTLDQLTKTNKKLEEFSYKVAHDLKEPLRGVGTHALLLLNETDQLPEKARERCEKIMELSKQGGVMIDHILDYSRLIGEEVSLVEVQHMLDDLVREIPDPLNQIDFDFSIAVSSFYGKPVLVREVFRNLVINGIKYNECQKKKIKISCEKERGKVICRVEDNGVGMTSEEISKILSFKLHVKQEKISSKSGTGFGLPIIKKIVDSLGGDFAIESQPGEGSIFSFSFPEKHASESNSNPS